MSSGRSGLNLVTACFHLCGGAVTWQPFLCCLTRFGDSLWMEIDRVLRSLRGAVRCERAGPRKCALTGGAVFDTAPEVQTHLQGTHVFL